jgi:protein SCO1/2
MTSFDSVTQNEHTAVARETSSLRQNRLVLAGGGLLLGLIIGAGLLFFLGVWPFGPRELNGTVIQSPQPVTNFTLTGPGGDPVSLRDFRGQVVMLYFGYTYCPDVCPATMAELGKMQRALGKKSEDVQVIMVSIDPERDAPAQLQEYVRHFHPSFIGLTGAESELLAATTPLGIYYQRQEGTVESGYLFDHTASVVAVDKKGYLRLVYPFGVTGAEMAEDIRYLARE